MIFRGRDDRINMIGGSYKNSDNEIAEELADGTRRVRFQPVPAWETADCSLSKPDRVREIVKNSFGKITETETVVKCPDINERERRYHESGNNRTNSKIYRRPRLGSIPFPGQSCKINRDRSRRAAGMLPVVGQRIRSPARKGRTCRRSGVQSEPARQARP